MMDCSNCGIELVGAKKYCVICGSPASGEKKDKADTKKKEEVKFCFVCDEEADKKCNFCGKDVCRHHSKRLQPNRMHVDQWRLACDTGNFKDVNQGWRGNLVYCCSRCHSMKLERELSEDEKRKQGTVDRCNWYEVK
jgi:hypothetical protein